MTNRLPHKPKCPICGTCLDAFANATLPDDSTPPSPGSATVCDYCATPLEFTEEMQFCRLDIQKLPPEAQVEVLRVVRLVRQYRAYRASVN